jgi:hypothetical protein
MSTRTRWASDSSDGNANTLRVAINATAHRHSAKENPDALGAWLRGTGEGIPPAA